MSVHSVNRMLAELPYVCDGGDLDGWLWRTWCAILEGHDFSVESVEAKGMEGFLRVKRMPYAFDVDTTDLPDEQVAEVIHVRLVEKHRELEEKCPTLESISDPHNLCDFYLKEAIREALAEWDVVKAAWILRGIELFG